MISFLFSCSIILLDFSQTLINTTAATFPLFDEGMKATAIPPQELNAGAALVTRLPRGKNHPCMSGLRQGQEAPALGRADMCRADGLGSTLCHRLGNGQILWPPEQGQPGPSFVPRPKRIPDRPPGLTEGASWLWHWPSRSCQTVPLHSPHCPSIPFQVSLSSPDHF